MDESRIRAIILEEIQGIIDQVVGESEGNYSPMVVAARSVGEIVAKRIESLAGRPETENQDTEIGKDPV
jgi:acetyl-CoA carboxylase alpha subunit